MKLLAELPLEETKCRTYALLCPCHKLIAQSQISIGEPAGQSRLGYASTATEFDTLARRS